MEPSPIAATEGGKAAPGSSGQRPRPLLRPRSMQDSPHSEEPPRLQLSVLPRWRAHSGHGEAGQGATAGKEELQGPVCNLLGGREKLDRRADGTKTLETVSLTLRSFLLKPFAKFLNYSRQKDKKPWGGCSYAGKEQLPKRRPSCCTRVLRCTPGRLHGRGGQSNTAQASQGDQSPRVQASQGDQFDTAQPHRGTSPPGSRPHGTRNSP